MSCFCVLGMHRSGTSCLTGIMQGLGVELGDVFTENLHNKRGNRENGRIVFLNDALLRANGGAWDNPVSVSDWNEPMMRERDAIIAELGSRDGEHWGFKDPRTVFTLPFWAEALDSPRLIGTFRHPQRVALSLHNRDQSPIEAGWELWRRYNERLLELADHEDFALLDFDLDDAAYLDSVITALVALGLDPQRAEDGRRFFDPALRNQTGSDVSSVTLPAAVAELYQRLRDRAGNPA